MMSQGDTGRKFKLIDTNSWSVTVIQYSSFSLSLQGKKRQYDQEVENLEKQQKQTIERLEQDHTNRLRDEAKRIKAEQDKELSKFQNMLKNRKKEVTEKERDVESDALILLCMYLFIRSWPVNCWYWGWALRVI